MATNIVNLQTLIAQAVNGSSVMAKAIYDSDDNGIVDNSEQLNSQLPSYYLSWTNFTDTPTTVSGYGITDVYTKTDSDARYEPIFAVTEW